VDPSVVGRDEPLAQLDDFIRAVGGRPASLLIEGEAGIGKTVLWQVAVDEAAERGYRVLVSRPTESETALAYSGLADLLTNTDATLLGTLPGPQREAIEVALLLSEPGARPPAPRAIFTAFGAVMRAIAEDAPVLLAVDDLQWLDRSSQRALEFVSRRLGEAPVGILITARLDEAGLPGLPDTAVIRLGPLSPAALHRLINAQVGVSLPRSTVLRVHRTAGGNPFFALELARVLVDAGLPAASEAWPVPDDLREMVAARVAQLPAATRSVLLTAAAAGQPAITGLGPSALRATERAGVVAIGRHGRVRFAHPLFASAIYEGAAPAQRRGVHAVLAAAEGDIEERARHRALASAGPDEEIAQLLEDAAERARARGAPDVAAELGERAFTMTPPDRPEQRWLRRLASAEHYFHAGDLERARSLLVELVDAPVPGPLRSRALRQLGEACFNLGELDDSLRHLRDAIDAADGDLGSIAAAEAELAFVLSRSFGSFEEAAAAAARALAAAEALGDESLLSFALAASASTEFFILGRPLAEEKVARALALEDMEQPSPIERRASFLLGFTLLHAQELDRARELLETLRVRLIERGEESDLPELLAVLARLECVAGDLDRAGALADDGYEIARQAGSDALAALTCSVRALVDAHRGRVDETRAAAAETVELAGRSGVQIAAYWASTAIGLLELSLGDDDAVVATLARSIEIVETHGLVEPSRQPFLPDAIEALVRLGELDRAERLTAQLEERGRALGRPWVVMAGARCRALVLAARGDVAGALAGLERALAEQPSLPMPLEDARTLIVKGQLERRRKQKRQARESLERALELCERIGAGLWAERARSELARLGRVADRDDLTATEARVAALAATGLTNREIAAAAFLSQKTVEANLSRIYRKLGIRSRAELGLRLAEREPV
jgi:DNA-binding CsgD family transcriptional regulator